MHTQGPHSTCHVYTTHLKAPHCSRSVRCVLGVCEMCAVGVRDVCCGSVRCVPWVCEMCAVGV